MTAQAIKMQRFSWKDFEKHALKMAYKVARQTHEDFDEVMSIMRYLFCCALSSAYDDILEFENPKACFNIYFRKRMLEAYYLCSKKYRNISEIYSDKEEGYFLERLIDKGAKFYISCEQEEKLQSVKKALSARDIAILDYILSYDWLELRHKAIGKGAQQNSFCQRDLGKVFNLTKMQYRYSLRRIKKELEKVEFFAD